MQLLIQYEKTIREVKNEFTHAFPNLALEFFDRKDQNSSVPVHRRLPDQTALGDIRGVIREGVLNIHANLSAKEVEQLFRNEYKLPARVFNRNPAWSQPAAFTRYTYRYSRQHFPE